MVELQHRGRDGEREDVLLEWRPEQLEIGWLGFHWLERR